MGEPVPSGLPQLLGTLEDYATAVPDEVTAHAIRKSGYDCKDVRTTRLVSVAAQRFVAGVLDEALNVHKRRKMAPAAHLKAEGLDARDKRLVLSTEDLAEALREYGINIAKVPYYADSAQKPQ